MRSSQCPQWEVSVAVSPRGVAKLASNSELVKLLLFWNRKSSSGTQQRRWQQECNGSRVDIISQGEEMQHTCPQRTRRLSGDKFIFGKISSEMPLLVVESSRMRQSCCIRAHFRKLSKELSAILQWSTNFLSLLMSSLETSSG